VIELVDLYAYRKTEGLRKEKKTAWITNQLKLLLLVVETNHSEGLVVVVEIVLVAPVPLIVLVSLELQESSW
jgi:hypothetical protein